MQIIIAILIVVTLSYCKKPTDTSSTLRVQYVNSLFGQRMYDAENTNRQVGICPFGVQIDAQAMHRDGNLRVGKCLSSGLEGAYDLIGLSDSPKPLFVKVISRDGLNLREDAAVKSKALRVLPYKSEGQILKSAGTLEKIQGKSGIWVQILDEKGTGWIFTGFVLIGDSLEYLRSVLDNQYYRLSTLSTTEISSDFFQKNKIKRSVTSAGWEIIEFNVANTDGCETSAEYRRNLLFRKNGRYFRYESAATSIISIDNPMPGILVARSTPCICCCATYSDRIFILGAEEIKTFPIRYGKNTANCGENGNAHTETRYSDNNLMVWVGIPKCFIDFGAIKVAEDDSPDAIFSEVFIDIDSSLNPVAKQGIPFENKEKWSKTPLLLR